MAKQQAGFTLVELLVVAALGALLAGAMLPALARTQPNAKAMVCSNNLRQWVQAMTLYGADNREALPRDGMGLSGLYPEGALYNGAPGTPTDLYAWFNLLPPYLAAPGLGYYAQLPGSDPRQKFPFPGSTNAPRWWHCPGATMGDLDYAVLSGAGASGFFSYAMNIDLKKQTSTANFTYPAMPRRASLLRPASTVVFFDCAFNPRTEALSSSPEYNSVNPAGRWRSFTARHVNGANIAFLDGQAKYFPLSYVTNSNPAGNEPLLSDVVWNAPYRLLNP